MVFQYRNDKYKTMLERAMQIASELKDDQLMADIYVFYAEIAANNNHLLYNLKAIDIQRRIGFSHFTTVHNRFFIVSDALYRSQDYRQSIQYGLECLSFVNTDKEHWLRKVYILQLDILGASYRKLGIYDSTVYYYQKILDTLRVKPDTDFTQKLWTGIAKGNIGYCLALNKNYSAAIPLIREYIGNSLEVGDSANIAIASNLLAKVYYDQRQYGPALQNWRQAFLYSDKHYPSDNLLETTKGMVDTYKTLGSTDSAFYYYDLYHIYADTLDDRRDANRLSAMNARIAFDNLQESLDDSQTALSRSRTILSIILTGGFLSVVILLLLYNRHRMKSRYNLDMMQRKNELAEQKTESAKKLLDEFMSHINEKNDIISDMQKQLDENAESLENKVTTEKLSQYLLLTEDQWEMFRVEFSDAYPEFFKKLRLSLPQVTPAEERLSALIYLKINNYQIANMLGIERDSVFRARRRLRQRLNLPENQTLDDHLYTF